MLEMFSSWNTFKLKTLLEFFLIFNFVFFLEIFEFLKRLVHNILGFFVCVCIAFAH